MLPTFTPINQNIEYWHLITCCNHKVTIFGKKAKLLGFFPEDDHLENETPVEVLKQWFVVWKKIKVQSLEQGLQILQDPLRKIR